MASTIERLVAALAERQHGVVAIWQLMELGLGRGAIQYRDQSAACTASTSGVYAVGHPKLTRQGHWMAAVLAYGPDAVLSHRTAAALWGIGQSSWKIDVTTPPAGAAANDPAHTQAPPEDRPSATASRRRASPARSSTSPAAAKTPDRLIEESDRTASTSGARPRERAPAARRRHQPPERRPRDLPRHPDTRSKLERDFRSLIARAGLPEPQFNVLVAGLTVDVWWPQWKLVVELDGEPYHTDPERLRVRPHPRRHSPETRHPRAARHRRSHGPRAGRRARRHPRAQAPGVLDLTSSRPASGSHDRFSARLIDHKHGSGWPNAGAGYYPEIKEIFGRRRGTT